MSRMRVRTRDVRWLALDGRASETVFWFSYLYVYHVGLAWVYPSHGFSVGTRYLAEFR